MNFQQWYEQLRQEYLRRVGLDWEAEAGGEENARRYFESGDTPTEVVDHQIEKYGLIDLDTFR